MALERSDTMLCVAKISYQSDNGLEIVREGQKILYTHTHTHTQTHTQVGPFYKSCFSAKMQKQD